MNSEKLTVQELVQILFSQDKEIADENGCDVEKDGLKAYDGWLQASSSAGDSQTRKNLKSVDRIEFAQAWEDLAWAQDILDEDGDEDDDDDDDDEDDIESEDDDDGDIEGTDEYSEEEEEKRKKNEEWKEALNDRR